MRTVLTNLLVVILISLHHQEPSSCLSGDEQRASYIVPPALLQTSPYAEWAHYHWVWLSNDRANQASMIQYAKDYMARGIKVGAVDIDSGWSTGFNNFVFDTKKYPNASDMISFFHSQDIRVILWATSFVDTDSSNYKEAHDKKYLVRNLLGEQAAISWWHGKGGLLDYSNEEAVEWWHSQMDKALDLGIDGWKCDGTDPYILETGATLAGRRKYSDAYYGDFFDYTRKKLGSDRFIMSRPVDGYSPLGVYLDFSPRRVMYSGWVGDQDPTFHGLEYALRRYLQSAWAGYANFGSDIGGYRTGNSSLGRTKELFIRWAQLGAFSPLMENGGNKEHRPWAFDSNNQTLNIYAKFVAAHYQLVPYLLTTGSHALETHTSSITPLAPRNNYIEKIIDDFTPPTYDYLLGKDIYVAPIYAPGPYQTRMIRFPSERSWVYWWDHSRVYNGTIVFQNVSLEEYPVFFAKGSFIPLRVSDQPTILPEDPVLRFFQGSDLWREFPGYLRWLLHLPQWPSTHDVGVVSTQVREEGGGGGLVASYWWSSSDSLVINITAHQSTKSLLHLAGMPRPLRQILVHTGANLEPVQSVSSHSKLLEPIQSVQSYSKLKAVIGGYVELYWNGFYHALVKPSDRSDLGHSLYVLF